MILLQPDCLVFKTVGGENIPCPAEAVAVELLGPAAQVLERHVIENATAALLHYFRTDLGRTNVSVQEFSEALKQVLRDLGFNVEVDSASPPRLIELDLQTLAGETGGAFELLFFARLRDELRRSLGPTPKTVRLSGLRGCVKQLIGAKRWSGRCQDLNDQIVDYLRTCLGAERGATDCALIVL